MSLLKKEPVATIYAKNFPRSLTDSDFDKLFNEHEGFIRTVLKCDENGRSLKFGLAIFETEANALAVIAHYKGHVIEDYFLNLSLMRRNLNYKAEKIPSRQTRDRHRPILPNPPGYAQPVPTGAFHYTPQQITFEMLHAATPHQQQQVVQERMFPYVQQILNNNTAEIAAVMKHLLRYEVRELFELLNNPNSFYEKVEEYRNYQRCPRANQRKILSLEEIHYWKMEEDWKNGTGLIQEMAAFARENERNGGKPRQLRSDQIRKVIDRLLPTGRYNAAVTASIVEMEKTEPVFFHPRLEHLHKRVLDMSKAIETLMHVPQ